MLKVLASILPLLSALTVSPTGAEAQIKPVLVNTDVALCAVIEKTCGAYRKDGGDIMLGDENADKPQTLPSRPIRQPRDISSADASYEEMKKKLDENFAKMFDIKKELDVMQSYSNAKWEEYHALQQAYNKQLKQIIASWVTDTLY